MPRNPFRSIQARFDARLERFFEKKQRDIQQAYENMPQETLRTYEAVMRFEEARGRRPLSAGELRFWLQQEQKVGRIEDPIVPRPELAALLETERKE